MWQFENFYFLCLCYLKNTVYNKNNIQIHSNSLFMSSVRLLEVKFWGVKSHMCIFNGVQAGSCSRISCDSNSFGVSPLTPPCLWCPFLVSCVLILESSTIALWVQHLSEQPRSVSIRRHIAWDRLLPSLVSSVGLKSVMALWGEDKWLWL